MLVPRTSSRVKVHLMVYRKNVVYSLEMALDIIVTHEQCHLEQAKEILKELKK